MSLMIRTIKQFLFTYFLPTIGSNATYKVK